MLPKGLGGLGGLGDLTGMMKQAMSIKDNMESIKESLGQERIEASSGGGMVTITMTGKQEVIAVHIDPEIINPDDPEILETLVQAAVNDANTRVQELVKSKMTELTGGIDIPGLTS